MAWQFEQIRRAVENGWPWARIDLDRPLAVVAAKDEKTMQLLVPRYWSGDNQARPGSVLLIDVDRYAIAIRTDVKSNGPRGVNPFRLAYGSYGLLMVTSNAQRKLPVWLTTGFSEILSNINVSDDEVEFGQPLPEYVKYLQQTRLFSLSRLLAMREESPEYRQPRDRYEFSVECWALMQYILFGEQGSVAQSASANKLAQMLLDGAASTDAISTAYGSVAALEAEVRRFIAQGLFKYRRLKVDSGISSRSFAVRTLATTEEALIRGRLYVADSRVAEARAALAAVPAGNGPETVERLEIEARLLEMEKRPAEAKEAFRRAVDAGSGNFYVLYRLAALTWAPGQVPTAEIEGWLQRSVVANPRFAPARFLQAVLLAQTDRLSPALEAAEAASAADLRNSAPRLLRATLLERLARRDEALREATAARQFATSDEERRMAQAMIDRLGTNPPVAGRAPGPGGVIGGVIGGVPAPPPGPIAQPRKTKDVAPVYPDAARMSKVEGVVSIDLVVGPSGGVTDARVTAGPAPLHQAALEAVRQWQYEPVLVKGAPISFIMHVTVTFALK
jgi:TonB family protein